MPSFLFLALLIPLVAILAGTYQSVQRERLRAARAGGDADEIRRALDEARAERDRLRARIEALEAIVTDDGFDLARDARRAGLEGRLSPGAIGDALADPPHPTATEAADAARRARTA